MFEIDKTRKHFVPRFYLRGFCPDDRPGQIYVFDKNLPEAGIQVRSIDKVEVSKDAYSVANDSILQQQESRWSGILTDLAGKSVDDLNDFISDRAKSATLRAWLARLVVDSRLRSRGFREESSEPVRRMRLRFRREIDALEADFATRFPDLRIQWQVLISLVKRMTGTDDDRRFAAVRAYPFLLGEEGEKQYRWYEEGSWRFDAAPEGRKFITSDIPSASLLLGHEPQHRNWMWFKIPLSAKLQLIGMCGDARRESGLAPSVGRIHARAMDLANVCVFQSAARFVYASTQTEILRAYEQSRMLTRTWRGSAGSIFSDSSTLAKWAK